MIRLVVVLVGLFLTGLSAQQTQAPPQVSVRGSFSIVTGNRFDGYTMGYANLSFVTGTSWTLQLGGADPNVPFALCASQGEDPEWCTPNSGVTDQYGNWSLSGTFDGSAIGAWTEWLQFPSGAVSNRIAFTVSGPLFVRPLPTLTLNGMTAGVFHLGQSWTLSLAKSPQLAGLPFSLCGEIQGIGVSCTDNFDTVKSDGSWSFSGTFSDANLGGWTLWLKFPDGTLTDRLPFIVDTGSVEDTTCDAGTVAPSGPNAGYGGFFRFSSYWYPAANAQTEYRVMPPDTGNGYPLDYLGCVSANDVWIEWAANGTFMKFAVRAPWAGKTDRGLGIGDTLARFQTLYPSAHHPSLQAPQTSFPWPADFDVWDEGPLRVVLQQGVVTMMQVDWTLIAPNTNGGYALPTFDQQEQAIGRVGPTSSPWY